MLNKVRTIETLLLTILISTQEPPSRGLGFRAFKGWGSRV